LVSTGGDSFWDGNKKKLTTWSNRKEFVEQKKKGVWE
jgi:hypothetical protein